MSDVLGVTQPVVGGSNDSWGGDLNDIDIELGLYTKRLQLFTGISSGDGEYTILMDSRFPYLIKRATVRTSSGVATIAVKIDSTAVTGLSALSATTTKTSTTATALNAGVIGSDIVVVLSGVTADTVYITLYVDRTGAGTP
jgi:hypothetical protein